MKVLYVAAECKPFSKVGGVGDVAGELAPALRDQGVDIEIVTPLYGRIASKHWRATSDESSLVFHGQRERVQVCAGELEGVPVSFLKNETYFEGRYAEPYIYSQDIPFLDDVKRFSFFSEACLHVIRHKKPDIVHVNDWVLGYLFGRMAEEDLPPKRVISIHNIGYQGNIWKGAIHGWQIEQLARAFGGLFDDPVFLDCVNALRLGLELCHMANTVSPNYCLEVTQPEDQSRYFEGGKGLHHVAARLVEQGRLIGILNGFKYAFAPGDATFADTLEKKAGMKQGLAQYFRNPDNLLLGFVGRAVEQKFKLLTEVLDGKRVLEHILDIPGINVAILATGLPEYEAFIKDMAAGHDNFSCVVAFDPEQARQISLGSDIFLMPSLFEPCGITQMESLSNATPPLVRWTGGLVDTVKPYTRPDGTGFGFDGATREQVLRNLVETVRDALEFYTRDKPGFERVQRNGFNQRFGWRDAAKRYVEELYLPAMKINL